jgi:hypothetical protein
MASDFVCGSLSHQIMCRWVGSYAAGPMGLHSKVLYPPTAPSSSATARAAFDVRYGFGVGAFI